MRLALNRHPDFPTDAVSSIGVEVTRPSANELVLRYVVAGTMSALRLPPPGKPAQADELWKHTCLEVFIPYVRGPGYSEFNFAPSLKWAAYSFSDTRARTEAQHRFAPPVLTAGSDDRQFELTAAIDLTTLPPPVPSPLRLGLSAIIEETSGRRSYWALTHPPGKPDFHHSDCFALELP